VNGAQRAPTGSNDGAVWRRVNRLFLLGIVGWRRDTRWPHSQKFWEPRRQSKQGVSRDNGLALQAFRRVLAVFSSPGPRLLHFTPVVSRILQPGDAVDLLGGRPCVSPTHENPTPSSDHPGKGKTMKFAMRTVGLAALAAGVLTLGLSSSVSAQRKLSFAYDQPV